MVPSTRRMQQQRPLQWNKYMEQEQTHMRMNFKKESVGIGHMQITDETNEKQTIEDNIINDIQKFVKTYCSKSKPISDTRCIRCCLWRRNSNEHRK